MRQIQRRRRPSTTRRPDHDDGWVDPADLTGQADAASADADDTLAEIDAALEADQ